MHLFFGDSHSRQFVGLAGGTLGHYVFSGATIKGLGSAQSAIKHGNAIQHAASFPRKKNIFLMFGSVDLDVTLYRSMCIEKEFDADEFINQRLIAYKCFVETLLTEEYSVHALCVLAPQISPLRGDAFFKQTLTLAGIEESAIRQAAERHDLTDETRNSRTLDFNDKLESSLSGLERVYVNRIDRSMVDSNNKIFEHFCSKNPLEHHAMGGATLNLWRPKVLDFFYGDRALPAW